MARRKKELTDHPRRWKQIKKKYGLAKEDYQKILQEQGGACYICLRTPYDIRPRKHLSVDHCHTTGKIRGLLCYSCNRLLLGYLVKDDVGRARRLLKYLTRKTNYGVVQNDT